MDKQGRSFDLRQRALETVGLRDFLEMAMATSQGRLAVIDDCLDLIEDDREFYLDRLRVCEIRLSRDYSEANEIVSRGLADLMDDMTICDFPRTKLYLGRLMMALTGKVSLIFDETVHAQEDSVKETVRTPIRSG